MRALIQSVSQSKVEVKEQIIGEIGKGMLILLGVTETDSDKEVDWLVDKLRNLRIFEDEAGKMNLSLLDIKGEVLIVSQFTLYADLEKGRRPSFIKAARPEKAEPLYNKFIAKFRQTGLKIATGQFQAMMEVKLTNHGPVTMMLESPGQEKIVNELTG